MQEKIIQISNKQSFISSTHVVGFQSRIFNLHSLLVIMKIKNCPLNLKNMYFLTLKILKNKPNF